MQYYRLINLSNYLRPTFVDNMNTPVYSSVSKYSFPVKKIKKVIAESKDRKLAHLQKCLKKVMKNCNSFEYIEKNHVRLFEEINKTINL